MSKILFPELIDKNRRENGGTNSPNSKTLNPFEKGGEMLAVLLPKFRVFAQNIRHSCMPFCSLALCGSWTWQSRRHRCGCLGFGCWWDVEGDIHNRWGAFYSALAQEPRRVVYSNRAVHSCSPQAVILAHPCSSFPPFASLMRLLGPRSAADTRDRASVGHRAPIQPIYYPLSNLRKLNTLCVAL